MTWSINHTQQAWRNARLQLLTWTAEQLAEAIADDDEEIIEQHHADDTYDEATMYQVFEPHQQRVEHLADLGVDTLVDVAIGRIADHGLCTNGGHEFYVDREGYHTVELRPPGRKVGAA